MHCNAFGGWDLRGPVGEDQALPRPPAMNQTPFWPMHRGRGKPKRLGKREGKGTRRGWGKEISIGE